MLRDLDFNPACCKDCPHFSLHSSCLQLSLLITPCISILLRFFFLKTESASRPLLHHLPFFGPSEETTLTFYKPVEIPMHTVTSVPFPIPRNMNCLLFLKVFCPYNQIAIIISHECLYTSAPYEPLHRRDCVLFILASWYIKHVNYSSLYIY